MTARRWLRLVAFLAIVAGLLVLLLAPRHNAGLALFFFFVALGTSIGLWLIDRPRAGDRRDRRRSF